MTRRSPPPLPISQPWRSWPGSCASTRSGRARSAGSGHPTSSMSAADLLAVLVARHLRYDWDQPGADGNDHLIFSKGHASPLLYSIFKAVGVVSDEELMTGYRRFGSRLQGHPTPVLPWVDVATGSLGQGLPDGVGVALAGKYLDRAAVPGVGAVRRQRDGRGLDLGGVRQGRPLRAGQPDRDRRRQPARPARPDRTGLGSGRLRAPGGGVRRPGVRDRRPRSRRDRPGLGRGGRPARRAADRHPGPHHQGPRRSPRSRTARAGTASRFRRTWPNGPSPSSAASATCSCADRLPAPSRCSRAASPPAATPRSRCPPTTRGEKVATRKAYGEALAALGAAAATSSRSTAR